LSAAAVAPIGARTISVWMPKRSEKRFETVCSVSRKFPP
jgi:hypothetical protein